MTPRRADEQQSEILMKYIQDLDQVKYVDGELVIDVIYF